MSAPDEEPANPAHALFEHFIRARQCQEVLSCFAELCHQLGLRGNRLQLYHSLKAALNFWSAKALWIKLDKKAGHKDYDQGTACASTKVQVAVGCEVGSPCCVCGGGASIGMPLEENVGCASWDGNGV